MLLLWLYMFPPEETKSGFLQLQGTVDLRGNVGGAARRGKKARKKARPHHAALGATTFNMTLGREQGGKF